MSFSKEWEDVYKSNQQLSVFPWSDLVSFVMRHIKINNTGFNVLELGCGAGANISFFEKLGVNYFAIEGSNSIVQKLWLQYPHLKNKIVCGDFTKSLPFDEQFDLVVDRSSLIHNTTAAIKKTLQNLYKVMMGGGSYIGIDWFSTLHSDFKSGDSLDDDFTRHNFKSGQFSQIGKVHFSDELHLKDLFSDFNLKILELKTIEKVIPHTQHIFASWNFVAEKK